MEMVKSSGIIVFLMLVLTGNFFAQDFDIGGQLMDIDAGKIAKAQKELVELKQKFPNSPSVLYLDALLTENGDEAVAKYNIIVENFPKSKYADDALYKVYSYYYASGAYRMADGYLQQLKDSYPHSEFIKIAEDIAEGKEQDSIFISTSNKQTAAQKNIIPTEKSEIRTREYKYTIQAGAFISLNNARNLKKSFESAGYFSEIKEKTIGGSILNVVTVGQYATESDAKSDLTAINKNFNLEGRVVPIH